MIGIFGFNNKRIISFVLKESTYGIQFDPERNGLRGLKFLSKVINMLKSYSSKQGKHMPSSHISTLPPSKLREDKPDIILILP